jgi:hypothetical protein
LDPAEYVLSEDGEGIQSPKLRVLNKNKKMDNVQELHDLYSSPNEIIMIK